MSFLADTLGFRDYTKASGDRDVYLNSVTGNDGTAVVNDPTKPYRNISSAYSQLRSGFGDRLRAARGSNFQDQNFPFWQKSGRNADEPMMISAYTPPGGSDTDPRPIFGNPLAGTVDSDVQPGLYFAAGGGDYLVLDSVHLKATVADTGNGIFWRAAGTDVYFQDCLFEGFHYGGAFVCNVGEALVIRRCTFFECCWFHNYKTTANHNEGLYFSSGREFTKFINCRFVENGSPDTLSHSLYADDVRAAGHPCDFEIDGCWFLNDIGSSHGAQVRPGGDVTRSVFLRNAIALQMGTGGIDSGGTDMDPINPSVGLVANVSQCLFAEGRNIGAADGTNDTDQPRGWGILCRWCYAGTIEDNLLLDGTGGGDSYAITLQNDDGTEQNRGGNRNLIIRNNVIYNWGAAVYIQGVAPKTISNSFTGNIIQLASGSKTLFTYSQGINGQITSANNIVFASGSTASTNGRILYNSDANSMSWNTFVTSIGDTGSSYSQVTFTDPNASSMTFLQASGVSGITTKDQAYTWLRDALVAHRRYVQNALLLSTVPYIDHHRIKFDMVMIGDGGGELLPPTADAGDAATATDTNRSGDEVFNVDCSGSSAVFPATITNYAVSEAKTTIYSGTDSTPDVTLTGFGDHTLSVVVTDSNGLASTAASVVKRLVPNTLTGFSATKDYESATTTVSAYPGLDTYQFQLGLTTSYNVFGVQSDPSNLFTGLSPSTTYHWRARGGGNGVFGAWSADQTFTTDALPVNLPPTADAGPSQTKTDTNLSGDESFTFDFSLSAAVSPATITNFLLKQGTTTLYSGSSSSPSITLSLGMTACTLTATDSNGLTAQDTVNMTLTPNAPVGLASSSITDSSAVSSVTAYSGTDVTYTHSIRKTSAGSSFTYTGPSNSHTWTGLDASTGYSHKVRVNAGGVSGAYCVEGTFTTAAATVADSSTGSILDDSIKLALAKRGRFIIQPIIDNRGDYPDTAGLKESLEWPISPQLDRSNGEVCYRYIAGPPGDHFPTSLRDCVLNFDAQIAPYIDAWLTLWGMPSGYAGWVHDDLEVWDSWAMAAYNTPTQYAAGVETYPQWTFHELFARFRILLHAKIRELRPNIKGIAVYGMGGTNPNFMIWDWSGADAPGYRNRAQYLSQAERYGRLFRSEALGGTKESGTNPTVPGMPFYDIYWSQGWTREERKTILLRSHEIHKAVFGNQFYRYAFMYFTLRSQRSDMLWAPLSISVVREIFTDALALGYRHFGVWDALESAEARDTVQDQITNVLNPLILELGGSISGSAVE